MNETPAPKPEARESTSDATAGKMSEAKIIRDIQVPPHLQGSETARLTVSFYPEFDYVRIKFKVDNPYLKIECDGDIGGEDCAFEFRFTSESSRQKIFEIWARTIDKESDESIDISCQDEGGNSIGPIIRRRIKLIPPLKRPEYKLFDTVKYYWYVAKRWYIRIPALVLLVVGLLFFSGVLSMQQIKTAAGKPNDWLQIKLLGTKEPYHFDKTWSDPFLAPYDRPDPAKWLSPGEWRLTAANDNQTDKTLEVRGPNTGIIKLPSELYSLYDYQVRFNIVLREKQKCATWILRAKSPRDYWFTDPAYSQDYYLFKLTLPSNESEQAKFEGFVYADGKQQESLTIDNPYPIGFHPFHAGDTLWVTILLEGFSFNHSFNVDLNNDDDDDLNIGFEGHPQERKLTDYNHRYGHGYFGFQALDQCDMTVEQVEITNAH